MVRIMDYTKFFTNISKRRKANLIRKLTAAYAKNPEAYFFAGGMPNAELFPFKEISVTYNDGTCKKLVNKDLSSALQYGPTQGFPPLLVKWREFQEKRHSPKYDNWDVWLTPGSMDGCAKAFELLLEPGDPVMTQSPTYTGIICSLLPLEPDLICLEMDDDGILPSEMIKVFEERIKNGKPLPKVLYVNPTGANPVGCVYSTKRKQEIYKLAQRYDFLIMEDDAYYFLHFLDEQPPSFLSMDVDGRVIRFDSFSKIMSAGLRLGAITAPKPLLEKMGLHFASTVLHPSSLSQVLIYELLNSWTDEDLDAHFRNLQKFYRHKRDEMVKAVEKHFTGIAEWSVPKGGMFVWIKVTVLDDVYDLIIENCVPQGVFAVPGHAFYPDVTKPCQYLRLCYSTAKPEHVEAGFAKIAEIIKQQSKKK